MNYNYLHVKNKITNIHKLLIEGILHFIVKKISKDKNYMCSKACQLRITNGPK